MKITRTYTSPSEDESVALWKGDSETGSLVFFQNGRDLENSEVTTTLCVARAFYVLSLVSKSLRAPLPDL